MHTFSDCYGATSVKPPGPRCPALCQTLRGLELTVLLLPLLLLELFLLFLPPPSPTASESMSVTLVTVPWREAAEVLDL